MNISPKKREPLKTTFQIRAEELAHKLVLNSNAREALSKENEAITKELMELMTYRLHTNELLIDVESYGRTKVISNDSYRIKITDKRATIVDTLGVLKKLIAPIIKAFINDTDTRRVAVDRITECLIDHIRKDAILVKKVMDTKDWAGQFIKENEVTPYLAVTDEFGRYIHY